MKTSTIQAGNSRPTIRNILMTLALGAAMGGLLTTTTAFSDDHDRDGRGDKGWHKGESRGRGYGYERRPVYRPVYREPYYYARPVYAPPPVYYPPQQSPGISLFLPLDLR